MTTQDTGSPTVDEGTVRQLGLRNVFVAGPFYRLVDPATGRLPQHQQQRFEALIDYFEADGCHVFNAHKRESWGEAFLEATDFTKLDFDEIAASDVLVAKPGPPDSLGTHIELGWASALGKPIVLLLERDAEYALMLQGLSSLTATAVVETVDGAFDPTAMDDALRKVCGGDGVGSDRR